MSVERKEMSENQTLVHLTFRSQGNEDTQSTEAEKECQVRQEKNQEWGVWKPTASKSKSDAPSKAEGRVWCLMSAGWIMWPWQKQCSWIGGSQSLIRENYRDKQRYSSQQALLLFSRNYNRDSQVTLVIKNLSANAGGRYKRGRLNPWAWKIPWRRAWQLTPMFLPGKSHGQRSLAGYNPWGLKVRHDWSNLAHTHTRMTETELRNEAIAGERRSREGFQKMWEKSITLHY